MKICFWGNVGDVLRGDTNGGGELQIVLLAKALVRGGHEVVILDYEISENFISADGIKVFKIDGWNNGIRILRTITHRLPQLYQGLKAQKADIYYCRIRDFRHIFAYYAARKVKAKFILGLASDLDAMSFKMRFKYQYNVSFTSLWSFSNGFLIEIIYPWLLRKADIVFVQHEGQNQILLHKNVRSMLFPNLIDLSQIPVVPNPIQNDFIYVGSLDKRKGFIDFFKLVKKVPFHTFKVIGRPRDKIGHLYSEKLKSCENVLLLGRLSHSDTLFQIANSKALILTSRMEGFPNVFIEAWAYGIPVLSLYFDMDDIIIDEKLGEVCFGNLENLIKAMGNIKNTKAIAERARSYVERNHNLNSDKIAEISHLFSEIYNRGK